MRYLVSYAYDTPSYADFVVEADSEEQAEQIAQEALDAGNFCQVAGTICWENSGENQRVFVQGPADEDDEERYGKMADLENYEENRVAITAEGC